MLFTTTTQFVVLALLFVAGWLFGWASHPGGRRWKERYATEREAHAATRREHDAKIAEARARNAELERDNDRLARAAPAAASEQDLTAPRAISAPRDGTTDVREGTRIITPDGEVRSADTARPAYPDEDR